MATTELRRGEITLDGFKYKLANDGKITIRYTSRLAQKQVIGDYTRDSDPDRSSWMVIGDNSGGMGIDQITKPSHANRSFYHNANVDFPGYHFLPKLASSASLPTLPTITDGGLEDWASSTDLTSWTETLLGVGTVSRQAGTVYAGTYSAKLQSTGSGTAQIEGVLNNWSTNFRGKPISISAYGFVSAGDLQLGINDGVGVASTTLASTGAWTSMAVTRVIDAAATTIIARGSVSTGTTETSFIDAIAIPAAGAFSPACEWNGDAYFAAGQVLYRLENDDGAIYLEGIFPATITHLIPGVNNCLYVFMGDSTNYYYITTAGVFTQTDVSSAHLGVHWNQKLAKISTTGAFSYTATPNAASPTWTAKATLDTGSFGTINGMVAYRNASGVDSIYVGTTKGLFIFDDTNNLWLNTDLKVATHTDAGKGMCVQNGILYFSSGLSVYEYRISDEGATIRQVGLDRDDGLPNELTGSITKLIAGYEGDMYALVDASLISASNYSGVYRYRNGAWATIVKDGTANQVAGMLLVSSVYAYRLWYNLASTLYYVPLDRARQNPIKNSASTYGLTSAYISPWSDMGWVGAKNALAVRALARAASSTETVAIKYRIDKTNTNISTGWTTLVTLVAADNGVEKISKFGSGAGLEYKEIQVGVDLARASGTTTLTPNLIYLYLEYERYVTPRWSFGFTIDCSVPYGNQEPQKQLAAIITAIESKTRVPFYYGGTSEPRYVRIYPAEGERLTGDAQTGQYRLIAAEN